MGIVLGSGYNHVPLAPESALAILAITTTGNIKAQRGDRENHIVIGVKNTQISVKSEMKHEVRSKRSDRHYLTCEAEILDLEGSRFLGQCFRVSEPFPTYDRSQMARICLAKI